MVIIKSVNVDGAEYMELVAFGDINKFGVKNHLKIFWEITEVCNFRCWYCSYSKIHKPKHPSDKKIKEIISFIEYASNEKYLEFIVISAAEPMTIPNIDEYMDLLSKSIKKETHIRFYTNMSAPLDGYKKVIESVLNNNIKLIIYPSFHKEYITVWNFFDKIQKLKEQYKNLLYFDGPAFMVHSNECIKLAEMFHNTPGYENVDFVTEKVRETYINVDQVCDDIECFRKTLIGIYKDGDDYKYQNIYPKSPFAPNFKNYICTCYSNNIHISYDGHLSPCNATKNIESGFYSRRNIIKRDFVICNVDECTCSHEIPKYKITEYNKIKNWTKDDILKLERLDECSSIL